jgi:hypothetical protein
VAVAVVTVAVTVTAVVVVVVDCGGGVAALMVVRPLAVIAAKCLVLVNQHTLYGAMCV